VPPARRETSTALAIERDVEIPIGRFRLGGNLEVPADPIGIVLFAHGSGSSRFSPRNRYVARQLQAERLGTLLIDLLTTDEERIDLQTRHLRFDIGLLAERLMHAIDWMAGDRDVSGLGCGLFGASTGAAAAIVAAANRSDRVRAVVSRGGRPDLAAESLAMLQAPTLLIVGGDDEQVIELNELARRQIRARVELEIVPGASHLFEEPGTLDQVARLASAWFSEYLRTT
jgi:putative phosphoribosyl transferase